MIPEGAEGMLLLGIPNSRVLVLARTLTDPPPTGDAVPGGRRRFARLTELWSNNSLQISELHEHLFTNQGPLDTRKKHYSSLFSRFSVGPCSSSWLGHVPIVCGSPRDKWRSRAPCFPARGCGLFSLQFDGGHTRFDGAATRFDNNGAQFDGGRAQFDGWQIRFAGKHNMFLISLPLFCFCSLHCWVLAGLGWRPWWGAGALAVASPLGVGALTTASMTGLVASCPTPCCRPSRVHQEWTEKATLERDHVERSKIDVWPDCWWGPERLSWTSHQM